MKNKLTLEDRTRIIGFSGKSKNSGIIKTTHSDILYRYRYRKPKKHNGFLESGYLDIAFLVNLDNKIAIIESRLRLRKGESLEEANVSNANHFCIQNNLIPFHKENVIILREKSINLYELKDLTKNLNFNYCKYGYDKILELYETLAS